MNSFVNATDDSNIKHNASNVTECLWNEYTSSKLRQRCEHLEENNNFLTKLNRHLQDATRDFVKGTSNETSKTGSCVSQRGIKGLIQQQESGCIPEQGSKFLGSKSPPEVKSSWSWKLESEWLQERESGVNGADYQGATALHRATLPSCPAEEMTSLLDQGADVTKQTLVGDTALHMAVGSSVEQVEKVRLLLKHGADVAMKSSTGNTALHIASSNGYIESLRLILDHTRPVRIDETFASVNVDSHEESPDIHEESVGLSITDATSISEHNNSKRMAKIQIICQM